MITYTEITTYTGNKVIQADLDNGHTLYIPSDPANSDYQAYLKYLEENN
jgi:hypothetical protein